MLIFEPVRFVSRQPWSEALPTVLVVACSDGRIQANIDDFLENHLGITQYDRLYLPGGPGALASGASEYSRAAQAMSDLQFLLKSHKCTEIILIFHNAAADGPDDAVCADYQRKHGGTRDRISKAQETDLKELKRTALGLSSVRMRAYRAEVSGDLQVQFVPMETNE